MAYFLVLLGFIFLVASLMSQETPSHLRPVLSLTYLVGFVIFIGFFCGIFSIRATDTFMRVVALGLCVCCIGNILSRRKFPKVALKKTALEKLVPLVIPTIFLILVGLLFVRSTSSNMNYLLNTWDGASNPGMVAGLRRYEQLNFYPQLLGLENYPSGGHYFASWLADLIVIPSKEDSLVTVQSFASVIFVVYAFLILTVGQIAVELGKLLQSKKLIRISAAILSQAFLVAPFLTLNLFLMHSLAFILALFITNVVILEILTNFSDGRFHFQPRSIFVCSLGAFIIVFSYPTFLPIYVLMFLYLVLRRDFGLFLAQCNTPSHHWLTIAGSTILIVFSILQVSNMSSLGPASSRFSLQGHLVPFSGTVIQGLVLFSITISAVLWKKSRALGTFVLLYVVLNSVMVFLSWQASDTWDRGYGLNYYAKKSEYVLVVLLLPIAIIGIHWMALTFISRWPKVTSTVLFPAVIFATSNLFITGTYSLIVRASHDFIARSEIMNIALSEANIPGRSAIWTDSNPELSRYASLMTNYIDATSWLEPDTENRTFILAQQMEIRTPGQPWQDSCGFIASSKYGAGRIVLVETGLLPIC